MHSLLKLSLIAPLFIGALASAQIEPSLGTAIAELRRLPNYGWIKTTDTPGAPFHIPIVYGKALDDAITLEEIESAGQPLKLFRKGERAIVNSDKVWSNVETASQSKSKPSPELPELLSSRTPVDELEALIPRMTHIKQDADGAWEGELAEADARAIMSLLVTHHAPRPDLPIAAPSGTLRVWIKNRLPLKYVITTRATVSVPFGKKELKKIATVNFDMTGSAPLEIPASALAALNAEQKIAP